MNIPPNAQGWLQEVRRRLLKPVSKRKPYERFPQKTFNILKGDLVQVIKGPESGKQGLVQHVLTHNSRIIVQNINMVQKRVKAQPDGTPARNFRQERALPYSAVQLVDPITKGPTKIKIAKVDGKNERVSKKSGAVIYRPTIKDDFESHVVGPDDTPEDEVFKVTFQDYQKYLPYIYRTLP